MESDTMVRGWPAVVLQNELIRVTVLIGKGCNVVEVLHKPTDTDIAYRTLRGLRARSHVTASPSSWEGSFLDQYEGGWQEIVPNGGQAGQHLGAPFAHHGEGSYLPWDVDIVQDSEDRIEIRCTTRLAIMPLLLEKMFWLESGSSTLGMSSRVTNEATIPLPIMWGNHLAFGQPFVGPGSVVSIPLGTSYTAHTHADYPEGRRTNGQNGRWPMAVDSLGTEIDLAVLPPAGTPGELLYLKPSEGRYSIHSPWGPVRATVTWNLSTHPYLWFWQQFGGSRRYPWWASDYMVGLEPWSSQPGSGMGAAVAAGTELIIAAAETRTTSVRVCLDELRQSTLSKLIATG